MILGEAGERAVVASLVVSVILLVIIIVVYDFCTLIITSVMSFYFIPPCRWLDKLGLAAKLKVTHLFRQTFFGAFYALVDPNLYPNPVCWILCSVLLIFFFFSYGGSLMGVASQTA